MTSSESLRGRAPGEEWIIAPDEPPRLRADRIEMDISWSDQDDLGWSKIRPRTRSRRSEPASVPATRRPESAPVRAIRRPESAPVRVTRTPEPVPVPAIRGPESAPVRPTRAPEPNNLAAPKTSQDVVAHSGSIAHSTASPLAAPPSQAEPETAPRRTVVIRGQATRGYVPARGGYEARLRVHERSGFKPDRVALWAVLLGLALLLGAVTSSHAATLHAGPLHHLLIQHALTHPAP